ncbi:MAG TPA: NERD domain-containing protein [Clostridiales bacterium]|nr:NERD domain-containing protein [Clostridiales bacterium]
MEYFVIVIVIVIVIFITKLPSVKGNLGEISIRIWLKFLNKDKYKVINNVMIPSGNGKPAQIDHIIVSVHGTFVIETKNYKGWIFGSENSPNWTQVIYESKNQFYNPILQNEGHVKALKNLLCDYPFIRYIPIVVFTSKAHFKKLDVTSHVIYSTELFRIIKNYTGQNISYDDAEKISKAILAANKDDEVTRKEHIARIQRNKFNRMKSNNGECPWCGKALVNRQGKYGRYTGCSNFPKCRFIMKGKR